MAPGCVVGRLEYARYESRPPPCREPSGSRSPSPVIHGARPSLCGVTSPGRGGVIGVGLAWAARWSARLLLVAAGIWLLGFLVGALWTVVFPRCSPSCWPRCSG